MGIGTGITMRRRRVGRCFRRSRAHPLPPTFRPFKPWTAWHWKRTSS